MNKKYAIKIDTYENGNLVLSHIFYGTSVAQAKRFLRVHVITDSFFRASMTTGKFRRMELTNKTTVYPVNL